MGRNSGKTYLLKADFLEYSLWKNNDIDDLCYPVLSQEGLPEDICDLFIRADFQTVNGMNFLGYTVGIGNIFCVALFLEDEVFYFNKNLLEDCEKNIRKLTDKTGIPLSVQDFSPLKYSTTIDLEGFKNINGEFDLLKERTDEERLGFST